MKEKRGGACQRGKTIRRENEGRKAFQIKTRISVPTMKKKNTREKYRAFSLKESQTKGKISDKEFEKKRLDGQG